MTPRQQARRETPGESGQVSRVLGLPLDLDSSWLSEIRLLQSGGASLSS